MQKPVDDHDGGRMRAGGSEDLGFGFGDPDRVARLLQGQEHFPRQFALVLDEEDRQIFAIPAAGNQWIVHFHAKATPLIVGAHLSHCVPQHQRSENEVDIAAAEHKTFAAAARAQNLMQNQDQAAIFMQSPSDPEFAGPSTKTSGPEGPLAVILVQSFAISIC
ncbi:MAG: hypothetical protein ACLQLT_09375 [Methylovirgula sp.]